MDGKTLARIGAAAFVGLAATVAAIEMTDRDVAPISQSRVFDHAPKTIDPLHRLLVRCQHLSAAAPHDPICLKAWADNRRRFLGTDGPADDDLSIAPDMATDSLIVRPAFRNNPTRKETTPARDTPGEVR